MAGGRRGIASANRIFLDQVFYACVQGSDPKGFLLKSGPDIKNVMPSPGRKLSFESFATAVKLRLRVILVGSDSDLF